MSSSNRYCPIVFTTKWDWDDAVNCLPAEYEERFQKLPVRLRNKIMRDFNDDLSRAFEAGIMHDWADCMYCALNEAGVEKGIDEVFKKWEEAEPYGGGKKIL